MRYKYLDFASPIFALAAFYIPFVYGELLFRIADGNIGEHNFEQPIAALTATLITGVVFLFAANASMSNKPKTVGLNICKEDFFISSNKIYSLLFISISALLLLGIFISGNPFTNPLGFRQAIQSGGAAYLLFCFVFILKLFGVYYFDRRHNKSIKFKDHLALSVALIFSLISGFASLFAYVFIAGFLYLNAYYGKRIFSFSLLLMGAGLIVFTPFYTMFREAGMSGVEIDLETLIEYTDRFSVNYLSIIFDRFDYFDNIIIGYWTALNNQNLTSLFGVLLQPLPRGLWPGKPYNFSTAMTALVYPDNIAVGVTGNFGFISEFIYYFGWIGLPFASIFFITLLFFTYGQFIKSKNSKLDAVFYVLVVWPYFTGFVIGYINDAATPSLIINLLFWYYIRGISSKRAHNL